MTTATLPADTMLAEMAQAGQLPKREISFISTQVNKQSIDKIRYTHDGMIDLVLTNPMITQREIAQHFGYREHTISIIFNSDAFKAQYEKRRAEVMDPILSITLKERFNALTVRSLEVLQEKLSRNATEVPDLLALKAAELGARSLGLGQPQATVVIASEDRLASLAHRLIALRQQPTPQLEILDVQSREIA